MSATDALRAECEKALREWWISPDASKGPIPGLGPPRMVDAAFRAGFNVLAPEVKRLRGLLRRMREAGDTLYDATQDPALPVAAYTAWLSVVEEYLAAIGEHGDMPALANRPEET